jgi:hypothetical protein
VGPPPPSFEQWDSGCEESLLMLQASADVIASAWPHRAVLISPVHHRVQEDQDSE